jgi:hypothetical protein
MYWPDIPRRFTDDIVAVHSSRIRELCFEQKKRRLQCNAVSTLKYVSNINQSSELTMKGATATVSREVNLYSSFTLSGASQEKMLSRVRSLPESSGSSFSVIETSSQCHLSSRGNITLPNHITSPDHITLHGTETAAFHQPGSSIHHSYLVFPDNPVEKRRQPAAKQENQAKQAQPTLNYFLGYMFAEDQSQPPPLHHIASKSPPSHIHFVDFVPFASSA